MVVPTSRGSSTDLWWFLPPGGVVLTCGGCRDSTGAVGAAPQRVVRHDGEGVPGAGSESGYGELRTGGRRYRVDPGLAAVAVPRRMAYTVPLVDRVFSD